MGIHPAFTKFIRNSKGSISVNYTFKTNFIENGQAKVVIALGTNLFENRLPGRRNNI